MCGECGTWLALRFRCLDCAARYRRWQKFRGRIGRVALMLPVIATLFGAGALAFNKSPERFNPSWVLSHASVETQLPAVCRFGDDVFKRANGCYWRELELMPRPSVVVTTKHSDVCDRNRGRIVQTQNGFISFCD